MNKCRNRVNQVGKKVTIWIRKGILIVLYLEPLYHYYYLDDPSALTIVIVIHEIVEILYIPRNIYSLFQEMFV